MPLSTLASSSTALPSFWRSWSARSHGLGIHGVHLRCQYLHAGYVHRLSGQAVAGLVGQFAAQAFEFLVLFALALEHLIQFIE